ncbi:MAG: hypothetical protein A7316_10250 [Candidatus Altiarchaeales archaeon WOR_SM1_86-2]|nr:MAG: hypothetical protein A7316_10250 [Candidatus Altiarchaeales archaeon WOR_SM1_86-2]
MRVWAIYYTVRVNSNAPWCKWTGPCGVYGLIGDISPYMKKCLSGRPFFFRTRALAIEQAKRRDKELNKTWKWVKYQVRPLELVWAERN